MTNEGDLLPLCELYDACTDDLDTILPCSEDILSDNIPQYNVIEIVNDMVKPIVQKNLDCPREGGCNINRVKCKGGSGRCKGNNAIGHIYNYECACGLRWKENNWMERERRKQNKIDDIRCVTICKGRKSTSYKCSYCGVPKKGHVCLFRQLI